MTFSACESDDYVIFFADSDAGRDALVPADATAGPIVDATVDASADATLETGTDAGDAAADAPDAD